MDYNCNQNDWCYFQYGGDEHKCCFHGACDDKTIQGAAPNTERGKCSEDTTDKPNHEAQ